MCKKTTLRLFQIVFSVALCAMLLLLGWREVPAKDVEIRLSSITFGRPVVLSADLSRFAGAISSLVWDDFEYVDSKDHGREIQSAMFFEKLGPCYNPTEAGSQWDSTGPNSSSKVLVAEILGDEIHTKVDAAFWLKPGTPVVQKEGCGWGARPDVRDAVNKSVRDGYLIEKWVRFSTEGEDVVLSHEVAFHVPRSHKIGTFDPIAAYLPDVFSRIFVFDGAAGVFNEDQTVRPYAFVAGPIVFSTNDGQHAFGVFCEDAAQYIYHRFRESQVVMANCRDVVEDVRLGTYKYRSKLVVGPLADVKATIAAISNSNVPPTASTK
ncbi:hypothetical protein [Ensifer adhaerens]|uniref:hypothetical protein n=1 Tax=Ensifer adhaerens TaxID=106592 RepID=UPI000FD869B2|nr:hypothetical protein [Ensifer adhaerens]MDF8358657.1 hypothetical protein [Ensifer adhaerens]THA59480.1 hypothetical protein E5176_31480 [Ensifer adhaerens]